MKWRLTRATGFGGIAERWAALHAALAASPLLAPDFVGPLLDQFGSGDEWLACCDHEGRTVAMALVTPRGRFGWGTFQPAQAPIGLWLQDPAFAPERLLAALLPRLPGVALVFGLTQCDPALLARPLDGPRLRTLDYIDTAKITLEGGFQAYWEQRGKNLRNNLKKQRARLERDGVAVRLQVSRAEHEVAEAVASYGRLEGAGWKAGAGTAVSEDNAQGRYYRALLEGLCRRGAGSMYRYWFGEQLVAMDLCIEDREQIIVLKTTYDETVPASLSPTLLMREQAVEILFNEKPHGRIEFYGKVMEWHTRWTDEVRTLYHINFYRWAALARLHLMWQRRRAGPPKENNVP